MTRRKLVIVTAALAVAAAVVGGTVVTALGGTPPPKATGPGADEFGSLGTLAPGEQRVHGVGASFVPASDAQQAAATLDRSAALSKATGDPLASGFGAAATPTAELVMYTNVHGVIGSDSSIRTPSPRESAWLMQWTGLPPGGLSAPAGSHVTQPADATCTLTLVLDAADGHRVDSFRECRSPTFPAP